MKAKQLALSDPRGLGLGCLRSRGYHMHGIELKTVQPAAHRRIVLVELPDCGLIGSFEDSQTEGSIGLHHRAVEQKFAGSEMLLPVERVLFRSLNGMPTLLKSRWRRRGCDVN